MFPKELLSNAMFIKLRIKEVYSKALDREGRERLTMRRCDQICRKDVGRLEFLTG